MLLNEDLEEEKIKKPKTKVISNPYKELLDKVSVIENDINNTLADECSSRKEISIFSEYINDKS